MMLSHSLLLTKDQVERGVLVVVYNFRGILLDPALCASPQQPLKKSEKEKPPPHHFQTNTNHPFSRAGTTVDDRWAFLVEMVAS